MIKFVDADEILHIRNKVLRNGKLNPDECRFPTDKISGAFHLGAYVAGKLVSITSVHPQSYGEFIGDGYQLRGMATTPEYQGRGFGNQLLNFATVYLREQKAGYLWCNARKVALKFYRDCGFETISGEFEIKG
ncbi:MAG: GNAT family N-acetyltransferase, partial [Mucilaginibacter sp.]